MTSIRLVSAKDPAAAGDLRVLNGRLVAFYNEPHMAQYFAFAHQTNKQWTPESHQWLVRIEASQGSRVLDMGCGSGHACVNLAAAGVDYTGVDWSRDQIAANQRDYGSLGRFVAASLYDTGLPANSFDVVFSFYVLEHLVWPHLFLRELVRLTRPGGTVIIVCPLFRPAGRIPSLRYGHRGGTLRDKVRGGHLLDALRHLYLRQVHYPRVIHRKYDRATHPFLINLDPACLDGTYYPDNDAVYLVDRDEIVAELQATGARDRTSEALSHWSGEVDTLEDVCCVVARIA